MLDDGPVRSILEDAGNDGHDLKGNRVAGQAVVGYQDIGRAWNSCCGYLEVDLYRTEIGDGSRLWP